MCGTPWYDEHDGHADVGHHREHHDIADVIADGGSRGWWLWLESRAFKAALSAARLVRTRTSIRDEYYNSCL